MKCSIIAKAESSEETKFYFLNPHVAHKAVKIELFLKQIFSFRITVLITFQLFKNIHLNAKSLKPLKFQEFSLNLASFHLLV